MTTPRCTATHDGHRCQLDDGHDSRHAATTPTSLTRWHPVTVDKWQAQQTGPPVIKGTNTCQTCSTLLVTKGHGQRYCGDECRKLARREAAKRHKAAAARRRAQAERQAAA